MMELMEPTTYILNPRSTELRDPGKWRGGIRDFLSATQERSLEQLKHVSVPPRISDIWLIRKQARFSSHGTTCKVSQSSHFLCIDCCRDTLGYSISPVESILKFVSCAYSRATAFRGSDVRKNKRKFIYLS